MKAELKRIRLEREGLKDQRNTYEVCSNSVTNTNSNIHKDTAFSGCHATVAVFAGRIPSSSWRRRQRM